MTSEQLTRTKKLDSESLSTTDSLPPTKENNKKTTTHKLMISNISKTSRQTKRLYSCRLCSKQEMSTFQSIRPCILFSCWPIFDTDDHSGVLYLHFNELEVMVNVLTETVHVLVHLQEQSNKLLCISFLLYLCDWQLNSENTHIFKSDTVDMH